MIIEMPTKLDVIMEKDESKIINDCIYVLESIVDQLAKHECFCLADFNGDVTTEGDINHIIEDLKIIRNATQMYDD
jgi:uncharacterized Zn ribbon protein